MMRVHGGGRVRGQWGWEGACKREKGETGGGRRRGGESTRVRVVVGEFGWLVPRGCAARVSSKDSGGSRSLGLQEEYGRR